MGKFKYPNTYTHNSELNTCSIHCYNYKGEETGTVLIDDSDFNLVSSYQWHIEKSHSSVKYAQAILPNKKTLRLHNLLLPESEQVDHINRDGLDNRRSNLRACNNAQNNRNKIPTTNPRSGHVGIRFNERAGSYYVRIMVNKKEISLGHYADLESAIAARKEGERRYFGEFNPE